ncbi:MAG: glutathione peroxidase [Pirellulales bacterium]
MTALYDIDVTTIDGQPRSLGDFRDNVLLVVNVASQCGFTPQYAGLQALQSKYHDRGFNVLGFPCNQFGHQEPGDEAEIKEFCSLKFDVNFPLFAKIDVNGPAAHPLYQFLKHERHGLFGTEAIKWNFTKFLIDRAGNVVKRYAPTTKPEQIAGDIEQALGAQS